MNPDQAGPARQSLDLAGERLAAARERMPALTDLAQDMADRLLSGGALETPPIAGFWPSEYTHRAGGFMSVRRDHDPRRHGERTDRDVALFALPDPAGWDPRNDGRLKALADSPMSLVVIGRPDEIEAVGGRDRYLGFTGAAEPHRGLGTWEDRRPLTPLRILDQFVRGWALHGEVVTACIRGGRMPTIYMSVWMDGAQARNDALQPRDNLKEPWIAPMFQEGYYVPPLPRGYAGEAFIDIAEGHRQTLWAQTDRLALAGQWLAEAHAAGRLPFVVAVGHSYPAVLGVRPVYPGRKQDPQPGPSAGLRYPLAWGGSISDIRRSMPEGLGVGDVVMHLGYSPVEVAAVREVLDRGIRFIYTSPYGRPAELKDHANLLWLDLPWRPGDAGVDIPGYSARICPMSSTAQTMAYFAILSETAHRLGWR